MFTYMNWKIDLEKYETEKDWIASVNLLSKVIADNPNDAEAYIRIIYLLHYVLLEENCPEIVEQRFSILLKKYFKGIHD